MRRRDFITLLGGAAAWPAAVHAQDNGRVARLGIVSLLAKEDSQGKTGDIAFRKKLSELGWVEGRNIDIQERWANGDLDRVKALAKELVALNPDALVGITTPATAALQHETKTIPIVFASVSDPIGSGFINSLANPGGNITGFIFIEASLTGKWPELMRLHAQRSAPEGERTTESDVGETAGRRSFCLVPSTKRPQPFGQG